MSNLFNSIKMCIRASKLTIIIPLLFIVLLFIGCKFLKKGEWNDEFLNLKQTKMIKGFCAIGIILHHCSQRTAAPWLEYRYIIHALDFFVDIGYFFVAVFLFFSGYGLYKSYKEKDDYFNNYFKRRIIPVVLALLSTSVVYALYSNVRSNYTWYVYAVILCYLLFYIGFKFVKKEPISFLIVIFGIVIYSAICEYFSLGGWWYNTIGMFVVGMYFCKYEKGIIKCFKKGYIPLLIILFVILFVCRYYGSFFEGQSYSAFKPIDYFKYNTLTIVCRFIAALCFTLFILMISLKVKFNNKVLLFYESFSLEFYLIQGLFAHMFSYSYFDVSKPLYYISNVPLYTIVVILCSTIAGYLLHFIDSKISHLISSKINKTA